jgi:hypothetical protein
MASKHRRFMAPPDRETLLRFMSLSIEDRLRWLEEAKEFVFTAMPPENRVIFETMRNRKPEE